ncbi:MAG: CBS domain-containing protein [Candidatus Odinarchaeia archaeon]
MQISEIMYQPLTIDKDSILTDALELMDKNKVTHIIVTDNNKVVGTVSDMNIADRLGSSRLGSLATSSIHVSGVMEPVDIFVGKDMGVREIADKMVCLGKSVFPVGTVDKLDGFVTMHSFSKVCKQTKDKTIDGLYITTSSSVRSDDRLINVRNKLLKEEIPCAVVLDSGLVTGIIDLKMIGKAFASFRDSVPAKYHDSQIRNLIVSNIMLHDPPQLKPTATISKAAEIFESKPLYGIPVVEDDKLLGVLYIHNLVGWVQNEFQG